VLAELLKIFAGTVCWDARRCGDLIVHEVPRLFVD
jgi:hypothetical protein